MVQIYPLFSLKSLTENFDLRKAFKFRPQVFHYTVSHHILPMAFRKTVDYEDAANKPAIDSRYCARIICEAQL
jgi:hypothetical protein